MPQITITLTKDELAKAVQNYLELIGQNVTTTKLDIAIITYGTGGSRNDYETKDISFGSVNNFKVTV